MMVMVDESTGNNYMRVVDHKGMEGQEDNSWLVKDMHEELKSWGHPGGARNSIILKRWRTSYRGGARRTGPMPWG